MEAGGKWHALAYGLVLERGRWLGICWQQDGAAPGFRAAGGVHDDVQEILLRGMSGV